MADLKTILLRTRDGYDTELELHRFLLDAYQGTGGFEGSVRAPSSALGSAAACYGSEKSTTYLDRYQREDEDKFKRRQAVAYYLNYVEALTDLKIDFMLRKPFVIEGLPARLEQWAKDVDGDGATMARMRERVAKRSAIFGWIPTFVDMPPAPEGVRTRAQATAAQLVPKVTLLYPANLTDFDLDGSSIRWAKIRTDFCERVDPFAEKARKFARIDVWRTDRVESFEVDAESNGVAQVGDHLHGLGMVPIAIARHEESEDHPIFGRPMHGNVSVAAKRLFNLSSELDEVLRGHGFPALVLVEDDEDNDGEPDGGSNRVIGAQNALTLPMAASQKHYYLEMSGAITEAFEKRIEAMIREMHRMAGVQYDKPSGREESGFARKYAFARTNAAIAAFAENLALWERDIYILAGRAYGIREEELQRISVIAPQSFDIEDLNDEIKRATEALRAKLGATATKAIKLRIAKRALPDVSDEVIAQVEEDLDNEARDDAADAGFSRSSAPAPKTGRSLLDPDEDEGDEA